MVYEALLSAAGLTNVERHIMLSVLTKQDVLCIMPIVLHVLHMQNGIENMNSIHSKFQKDNFSITHSAFPAKKNSS